MNSDSQTTTSPPTPTAFYAVRGSTGFLASDACEVCLAEMLDVKIDGQCECTHVLRGIDGRVTYESINNVLEWNANTR